jgi:TonB family protein
LFFIFNTIAFLVNSFHLVMIQSLLNTKLTVLVLLFVSWLTFFPMIVLAVGSSMQFISYSVGSFPKSISSDVRNFQEDQIYDIADKMPRPVGGQDAWESYLSENLKYPHAALKSKIEGVVYVVFILEKDGRVSNVQVGRGIGGGCDEEAKRLVKGSPKWTPGQNNGEPVRVRMRVPIRFHLPQ